MVSNAANTDMKMKIANMYDDKQAQLLEELRKLFMKALHLGFDATGRPTSILSRLDRLSHMHVIGSSGSGKRENFGMDDAR